VSVIVIGEGNQNEFIQSVNSAPLNVFAQTQFMKNVDTLDTQRQKAYAELEKEKKENAQNAEKISQLQKAYDDANKAANDNNQNLQKEIASLKDQLANVKTEVHNHYHDDGGSDCVII